MRIARITLQNFRAFDEQFELDLGDGKNLLLHGENGSGKSSIYLALKRFFEERSPDILDYKNYFAPNTRAPEVCLHLISKDDLGNNINEDFRWNATAGHPLTVPNVPTAMTISPAQRSRLVDGARRSGFIDYRSMLKTHLISSPLPRSTTELKIHEIIYGALTEDIGPQFFDLVSLDILSGVRVTTRGGGVATIGELARKVWESRPTNRRASSIRTANAFANVFNDAFNAKLPELTEYMRQFLAYFENNKMEVSFPPVSLAWGADQPELTGAELYPEITFRGTAVDNHHEFLNEARLSAIATCLFLAGVKLSDNDPGNPQHARLLILDDALIGLDLENRQPILRILSSEAFKDYQIILLTHDRVWFDLAKGHFPTKNNWLHVELLADEVTDKLIPRLKPCEADLARAASHLRNGDRFAAAVYARAAFEWKLRSVCEKKGIELKYKRDTNEIGADDLWQAILKRQRCREATRATIPATQDFIPLALERDIEVMRSTVLNQLSHGGGPGLVLADVRDAIKAVEGLHKWGFPEAMAPRAATAVTT